MAPLEPGVAAGEGAVGNRVGHVRESFRFVSLRPREPFLRSGRSHHHEDDEPGREGRNEPADVSFGHAVEAL